MAFRFRRAINICPGVRLNVGKSGVTSLSVGPRGSTLTLGSQGAYANVGVPGTGLSYRKRLSKGLGQSPIDLTGVVDELKAEHDSIFNVHKNSPNPSTGVSLRQLEKDYIERVKVDFDVPFPAEPEEPNVPPQPTQRKNCLFSFFQTKSTKLRKKAEYQLLVESWELTKLRESEYYKEKRSLWVSECAQWKRQKDLHLASQSKSIQYHLSKFSADADFFENRLKLALSETQWPRETNVSFQVDLKEALIQLEVDLPEIEDMPRKEYRLNKRGTDVLEKEKSDRKVRLEYARLVHGILFKIVSIAFYELPLNRVSVSGFTQRISSATGRVNDDYILQVTVDRNSFLNMNFNFENLELLDPVKALEQFDLNRNMTTTGIFRNIRVV